MYRKKSTGSVFGAAHAADCPQEKAFDHGAYRVFKTGRVLTLHAGRQSHLKKGADITAVAGERFEYYQIVGNEGACAACAEHDGAIYPTAGAKEGETLPPFHPNCKCEVRGFSTGNPNDDPWLAEQLLWLDLMYGSGTTVQKAQKILDFYQWTEFSTELIAAIMSSIDDIRHIGKRMQAFFRLLSPDEEEVFELPGVHFEGKTYPLYPLKAALPTRWLHYISALGNMLDIDYYLVIAFILHESGGDPTVHNTSVFSDPMRQTRGLMQVMPGYHSAYLEGGLYYPGYTDVIAYAQQHGADLDDLFDPLGNITVGMMMLNENRKRCVDPSDMREWVGLQGEGPSSASTIEVLYYRDQLAMQAGLEPWYADACYQSQMKK